jgi:hypothetical protein
MHLDKSVAPTNMPAIVLALVLLGVLTVGSFSVAQYVMLAPSTLLPAPNPKPAKSSPSAVGNDDTASDTLAEIASGPGWETLNTPQKLALYPLAERWAALSEGQKRRWLAISQTFASLPAEEQEKLHNRMTEWASLSGRQRSQARLNYADAQRLNLSDKRAQWEAYQALSEEEKRLLAADAPAKPTGAATALRPVAPQKLAKVPAAVQAGPARANPPKIVPVDIHSARPAVAPVLAPPAPESTSGASTPPVIVETNPISTPSASGTSLPPLSTSPSVPEPAAPPPPAPRPEDLGYQPQ